ncbi:MAG: hypothetical protein AAF533_15150 [Acidobacteriota bacterium]
MSTIPTELARLCRSVLGATPDSMDGYTTGPKGKARDTHQIHVDGISYFATRRESAAVAEKEARVLEALSKRAAPVPRFLAFEDGWLLQESAGEKRLSEALNEVDAAEARALLERACDGLASIQAIGAEAELAAVVTPFATGEETADRLLAIPDRISELAGVAPPSIDDTTRRRLREHLASPGSSFIKWDARPANAAVGADGAIRWFDWQHCNRRHRADDLVWFACDESVPAASEPTTLLTTLASSWGAGPDYVAALGVAHVGTRMLSLLTGPVGLSASWRDCLAHDWCGSRESACRLSRRGAEVARLTDLTAGFVGWFESLSESFANA